MSNKKWTRIPKGTPDSHKVPSTFDYGALKVERDGELVASAFACKQNDTWSASLTLYSLKCDNQDMAESLAEYAAEQALFLHEKLRNRRAWMRTALDLAAAATEFCTTCKGTGKQLCATCRAACCRDELGYRVTHLSAEVCEHECEDCQDGLVPCEACRIEAVHCR